MQTLISTSRGLTSKGMMRSSRTSAGQLYNLPTVVGSPNRCPETSTRTMSSTLRASRTSSASVQRNTVSQYQRRYSDMPRPIIDLGQGRCKLWLRSELEQWHLHRYGRAAQ